MLIFDRQGRFSPLRAAALALCCAPALWLGWGLVADTLGPKTLEALNHETGVWSLRLLLATLAISPLRLITGWNKLITIRRMLGVSTFAYAFAHLVFYIADQKFDLIKVASEIALRFYLTIGFLSLLALGVLAATSFDSAVKRLGAQRWSRLHSLVYPLTVLALWHAALQAKLKVSEPTIMAGVFVALMLMRLMRGRVPVNLATLSALALIMLPLTAGIEYLWYALATNIPAARVFSANFTLALAPRPALVTAMILLALPLASLAKQLRRS